MSTPLGPRPPRSRASRVLLDALLLGMVVIWAGNYSLVKAVIAEMPPLAFNGLRLAMASLLYGAGWALSLRLGAGTGPRGRLGTAAAGVLSARTPLTSRDWLLLTGLGLVGHCSYQLCFINGLARTTVANSALISGCTPIAIALLSAWVGHERIARVHWMGAALSLAGIYLVAGRGAQLAGTSLAGDLLILISVACWAVYTVFSKPLLERHSPLVVTSATMIIGSAAFVAIAWPQIAATRWDMVSPAALVAIAASALLALNLAYLIWYTAVQRLGSARTSIFSNMVPPAAMAVAALLLGERVDSVKWVGAGAVLGGVLLTRLAPRVTAAPPAEPPVET
jgi:drug/metabolite transporter (DMT)-like permease